MKRFWPYGVACSLHLFAVAPAFGAHTLTNGRITLVLADGSTGLNTTDQDRVDSISWVDSNGASTGNLAANGGPLICGDPQEFFGQSYNEGDGAGLYLVVSGTVSTWTGGATMGISKTNGKPDCANIAMSGKVKSVYTLFKSSSAQANALKIQRMITFNSQALDEHYNLKVYVPRLPIGAYATVLVPDANGVIQTFNAGNCSEPCEVTAWNGKWFADINSAGAGMAVIRSKSSAAPALVAIDNDSYSASNLTSISLKLPSGGWSGRLQETEYLCFFDAKSWPASARSAGKLPKGCTVPVP